MCSLRILRRLRFVSKNSGTPKRSLKAVLSDAIDSLKHVDQHLLNETTFELFTNRSKEAIRLADLWAKHQKPAELKNLVEGVYQLKQVGDLRVLMDLIPNRAMCPSSRRNLVNIVSKVSRYREAARLLYRTARNYPSLRRAKVVPVSLPRKAFERVSGEYVSPPLVSTITRIIKNQHAPDFGYLCRLNEQFAVQTRKTLREAKIHAEVQLVFHYELNASSLPPRVVCSSKDACFLCNAFIIMHGKMYTPGHHGRLYPGWRLPFMSDLIDLDQRLNTVLEDHIRASMKALLSRKKKTSYPDPNESTLLTLQFSTSTLHTSALAEVLEREASSANNTLANDIVWPRERSTCSKNRASLALLEDEEGSSSLLSLGSTTTVEKDDIPEIHLSKRYATQESSQYGLQTTRRKGSSRSITELVQGVPQTSRVGIARGKQFHTARGLELHVEYTTAPITGIDTDNSEVVYSIEWVSVEKARALMDHRAAVVLDMEALKGEISYELDCCDGILLMAHGRFVRLITQRNEKGTVTL
jgi:hypothetical protein